MMKRMQIIIIDKREEEIQKEVLQMEMDSLIKWLAWKEAHKIIIISMEMNQLVNQMAALELQEEIMEQFVK